MSVLTMERDSVASVGVSGMQPQMRSQGVRVDMDESMHGVGYDKGGYLRPGSVVYINDTGKSISVLTAEEWARLAALDDDGPDCG